MRCRPGSPAGLPVLATMRYTFEISDCNPLMMKTLFQFAADQSRILVSEDTDFGTLLALRQTSTPSVILFRHMLDRSANNLLAVLLANLDAVGSYLNKGAVVVIEISRVRIRRLPISDTHGTQ